ncbi:MAG: DNA primase [Candidatus Aenigmarchaeota archaeon]|nr:DNA primase [Candidatus Aenigmarchaeota archaeon]
MAKLAQNFAKYMVNAQLNATGIVEKPDVIGAVFGQTEGLIGQDLDLRELQRTGRIGRIEVNIKNNKGRSVAEITIPSSLDASETSLIAASLETIEKVGPCDAKIDVMKVEDVRTQKRRYVIDRARDILKALMDEGVPDSQKLSDMVREAVRTFEVSNYQGLSCGPGLLDSDEIVVVEGRADVICMLKNGIRNCIAIEGSKIPDTIVALTKQKITTALLDGDRGGDLILRKLFEVNANLDFVARAEDGKEVEDLTKKEIFKALRERVSIDQIPKHGVAKDYKDIREKSFKPEREEEVHQKLSQVDEKTKNTLLSLLEDLTGTRAAYVLDKDNNILSKVPLAEMTTILDEFRNAQALVLDSKINQALVDLALQRKVSTVVGTGYSEQVKSPPSMHILTIEDMR